MTVDGAECARIGPGINVLVGIHREDTEEDMKFMSAWPPCTLQFPLFLFWRGEGGERERRREMKKRGRAGEEEMEMKKKEEDEETERRD